MSPLKKSTSILFPYFILMGLLVSIVFYSCRKSIFNPDQATLSEAARINNTDLYKWVNELPVMPHISKTGTDGPKTLKTLSESKLPFPIKWEKAQEKVVNGKHVVRIPITNDAILVFIKEKENAPLTAYTFFWKNEKRGSKEFYGKLAWFSFQDYKMRGQKIWKGKGGKLLTFPSKEDVKLQHLQAQKKQGATTKSWVGDFFHTVGNLIGALGCTITGGSWDNNGPIYDNPGNFNDSCSGQWSFNWNSGGTGGSEESYNSGYNSFFNDLVLYNNNNLLLLMQHFQGNRISILSNYSIQ